MLFPIFAICFATNLKETKSPEPVWDYQPPSLENEVVQASEIQSRLVPDASPEPVWDYQPPSFHLENEVVQASEIQSRLVPDASPEPFRNYPFPSFHLDTEVTEGSDIQSRFFPDASPDPFRYYPLPSFHLEDEDMQAYHSALVEGLFPYWPQTAYFVPSHVLGPMEEVYLPVFDPAPVDSKSNLTPSTTLEEASRLECAIRELAFTKENTRQLQEKIDDGEFSAHEVSLVSNDLLVSAMMDPYANFVVSCLIKNFPEIMFSKIGTHLVAWFENKNEKRGLRFLVAFLQTENLDIEDKIFSQMVQIETFQKLLLNYDGKFANVILKFVNSSKWADEIALFLLQNRKNPKSVLPMILACQDQHHLNLIESDVWIARNFSQEEIDLALQKEMEFDKSSRSYRAKQKEKHSRDRRNDF